MGARTFLTTISEFLLFYVILLCIIARSDADSASCYFFGTQHVYTFDSQRIDFISACEFTLAQTCPPSVVVSAQFDISVVTEIVYGSPDSVTRAKCARIIYKSHTVELCTDQTAKVDGQVIDSMNTENSELLVYTGTAGKEMTIRSADGTRLAVITVTTSAMVKVEVDSSYRNKLCGLCGDYDGATYTDLYTSFGVNMFYSSREDQGAIIATSFMVDSPDCIALYVDPFYESSCQLDSTINTNLVAPDMCGLYQGLATESFASCIANEADLTTTFSQLCTYDYCENYLTTSDPTQDTTSACYINGGCVQNDTLAKEAVNAIGEVFIDQCRLRGYSVSSWRSDYAADLTCLSDTSYSFLGEDCPDVCGLPSTRCSSTTTDGCICPQGQWRDGEGSICVDSTSCGCSDTLTGIYYSTGEWWLDEQCTTNYSCNGVNSITSETMFCSEYSACGTQDGVRNCYCNSGFYGDGVTCTKECSAGEKAVVDSCELCPIGTYQPNANSVDCISCPTNQVTANTGSIAFSECQDIEVLSSGPLSSTSYVDTFDYTVPVVVPSSSIPDGLPFGSSKFRTLYVSTNGIITFDSNYLGQSPQSVEGDLKQTVLAPFWMRADFSAVSHRMKRGVLVGNISDECEMTVSVYDSLETDTAKAAEATDYLGIIKILLETSGKLDEPTFEPTYALVVTWKNAMPYPSYIYSSETAFYQCIVVTDGTLTFAVYIYPSSGLNLDFTNNYRSIWMGYNAQDGATSYTFYLSGSPNMGNLDSLPSNTDVDGRWVFKIADGTVNKFAVACQSWYKAQIYYFPFGGAAESNPCPCNIFQAFVDLRYLFDPSSQCFYSVNRQFDPFSPFQFYQKCCFSLEPMSFGSLITTPRDGGFPILFNPTSQSLYDMQYYNRIDWLPYFNCCFRSGFCDLFRQYRPADTCTNYVPPVIASGFGDPHIYTLDGEQYTYNPIGEFWLIKAPTFCMQGRTVQALDVNSEPTSATQFQAFVMVSHYPFNSSVIQVEINNNRTDFEVRENGTTITTRLDISAVNFFGGVISKANSTISVVFQSGFSFKFTLDLKILSIQSYVEDNQKGAVEGLLGKYDGDASNDLTDRDGMVVCVIGSTCTDKLIHEQFGESWRITSDESWFWYRAGWSTNTYTDRTFKPTFIDINLANGTVTDICGDSVPCIYDVLSTNDVLIGESTKGAQSDVISTATNLGTLTPYVEGLKRLNVTVGEPTSVSWTTNYTGNGTITIEVISQPPEAVITHTDIGISFEWTPNSTDEVGLQLRAKEDVLDGTVSSISDIEIRLSPGCSGNGEPDFESIAANGAISTLFKIVACICTPGFEGTLCEIDYDGCAEKPCLLGTPCKDVPGDQYIAGEPTYTCNITDCPLGYNFTTDPNGVRTSECFDLNECTNDAPCGSNATCRNLIGSYLCTCDTGYIKPEGADNVCLNVNECEAALDNCEQVCTDTEGSFVCSCVEGYHLNADGFTCAADQSTVTGCASLSCDQTCVIVNSVPQCDCNRGYALNADNTNCDRIDYCSDASLNVCDITATCESSGDSYTCVCPPFGYSPLANPYDPCTECALGHYGPDCSQTCSCGDRAFVCDPVMGCTNCSTGWEGNQCQTNIDECTLFSPCGEHSACQDTNGSYVCRCDSGYTRINQTHCVNIDECSSGTDGCSKLAVCEDIPGSYVCTCVAGYTGDGMTCADNNECHPVNQSDYPCDPLASCKNNLGSFGCECASGYHGDGLLSGVGCKDDNECRDASNLCPDPNSQCNNTVGGYRCDCNEGYSTDGIPCVDLDECALETDNCSHIAATYENSLVTCINVNGSYYCDVGCQPGFTFHTNNDGTFRCDDIDECIDSPCDLSTGTCLNNPGSYICECFVGYEFSNGTCVNIDECLFSPCASVEHATVACTDNPGSYVCNTQCDTGYEFVILADGTIQCNPISACADLGCDAATEQCTQVNDSSTGYQCACKPGFENGGEGTCYDSNECLNSICHVNEVCTNTIGSYRCECRRIGYTPDCANVATGGLLLNVEQGFDLTWDSLWSNFYTVDRRTFEANMVAALSVMYEANSAYIGINILDVSELALSNNRRKRQVVAPVTGTTVIYEVAYDNNTVDTDEIAINALEYLHTNNYSLTFNGQIIKDLVMILFTEVNNGNEPDCNLLSCLNGGSCMEFETSYPLCQCPRGFEGYRCHLTTEVITETAADLLPLWISVAVAGALLIGGVLACIIVVAYQRRRRPPTVHRHPRSFAGSTHRGPALFNPASRMPAEAFNYQFPSGSVRDDISDTSSERSTATSVRTASRVGSAVPFAPRWPRAYYSNLGPSSED